MSSNSDYNPSNEEIAQRAREIWQQRGRPDGEELDHWYQAERELIGMRNQAEKLDPGAAKQPQPTPPKPAAPQNPKPSSASAATSPAAGTGKRTASRTSMASK